MNTARLTNPSPLKRTLLVTSGILFIVVWILAHFVWVSMALMANLMANDSGRASSGQHMSLIFGMIAGQILTTGAGIPAGMAFFWRGKRRLLLWIFAITFVVGALCQFAAFHHFFAVLG
ncbi:MAG: hypothetical protein ABI443_05560 [Chthoniobacterales bacterium]